MTFLLPNFKKFYGIVVFDNLFRVLLAIFLFTISFLVAFGVFEELVKMILMHLSVYLSWECHTQVLQYLNR